MELAECLETDAARRAGKLMRLDLRLSVRVASNKQIHVMNKARRNDPCPCGSGKKFKKYCLPREESAYPGMPAPAPEKDFITEMRPDVDDKVNRVLEQNPNHVQSYGNLGLAYAQLGKKALALECLDKALALDPGYEPARFNRLNVVQMQEGESLTARCEETEYYAEKLAEEKGASGSPPARRSWWERMMRLRTDGK